MKKILDLLNELDKKDDKLYSVQIFGDFSGGILHNLEEIADFSNKQECIKELKFLLSEK